jgi:MATE family multidrug resistance protein
LNLEIDNNEDSVIKNNKDKEENFDMKKAFWKIGEMAFPSILFYAGMTFHHSINMMFVGSHYTGEENTNAINALGLGYIYVNCLGLALVVGLTSGIDVFCSNCWGVKNLRLFAVYFQRAQIIAVVLTIAVILFHYFTCSYVLSLFNIEKSILDMTIKFIRVQLIVILFEMHFFLNYRLFNIIGKTHLSVVFLIGGLLLHPLWCWIFISKLELGITGAAVSLIITNFLEVIFGIIYIYIGDPIGVPLLAYSEDSFREWWDYLKLTLPATFLFFAKFVGFECLAVIAIYIGKLDYTAYVLLNNIYLLLTSINLSFGYATTIITSKYICTNSIEFLKKYWKFNYIMGISFVTTFTIIIVLLRKIILRAFIADEVVINKAAPIMILFLAISFLDYTQNTYLCIYRGLRKHMIALPIVLFNLFIIQTSYAYCFGYLLKLGTLGVFLGTLFGMLFMIIFFITIWYYFDLNKIKEETILSVKEADSKLLINDKNEKDKNE